MRGAGHLDVEDIVISADGETATVVTAISSFSSLRVYRQSMFKSELTVPDQAVAGVPFVAKVVITRKPSKREQFRRQVLHVPGEPIVQTTKVETSEEWTLSGRYSGSYISPSIVGSAPPATALTILTFTANATFTCNSPGTDFEVAHYSSIAMEETWEVTLDSDDYPLGDEFTMPARMTALERASGECVAPAEQESTPASALPTPTPDPLEKASEVFLVDPTATPTTKRDGDGDSSASVELANGMTVHVEISPWGGNATLKKSWSGSVDFLQYILDMTVSGEAEDGKRRDVEYQVSAIEPRGLIDWTDVIQDIVGADAGGLEESLALPWAGDYVVKGSVGEEVFELTVAAIEPELRYGILAEPGTWKGRTPLTDEGASELADFSGEWSGWVDDAWLDEMLTVSSADVLQNRSKVKLERVDRYIEPLMTGVQQRTPDGGRTPYEMIVPRAAYEGTLSYNLPAFSYEDGNCGNEILTYDISGTVEYIPNIGPWAAPLVLTGTLSGPLPKLTREVPRTVEIEVISADTINRKRLFDEGGALQIIGPLDEGAQVGFVVQFSDMEVNTDSTINSESTCESYTSSIALAATR